MKIQLSDHFTYRRILRFSLPSILMMVFTSIYGVVDGFFVSNFAGKVPFAAVNFIMPFLMILGPIGFMVGTGGCALIGKTLGEGDNEKANGIFSMLVYFTVITSLVIMVIGIIVIRPVGRLLGADEAIDPVSGKSMLDYCVDYGRIVLLGLPAVMLQFEWQSFFVVAEKPQLGLYCTIAAGCTNMVLDGVLVGIMGLSIEGAAAATVVSQLVGGILPLIYFSRKNTSLLRIGKPVWDFKALGKALTNGSSELVSSISMSVVGMLYNSQLMKYAGENGVAAYGVLMYVNIIFLSVFIGYSVGTAPVFSFNFGAKNHAELKSLLGKSFKVLGVTALAMLIAGELLGKPLAAIFVSYDSELMDMTTRAFAIFSLTYPLAALPIFGSSFFTALNNGKVSAAISFLRTALLQVACVLILPLLWGIDGIWWSLVAAELTATLITVVFLICNRKKYNY